MFTVLRDLVTGFCIGVANIIPGVSGGTFLLVFGIFERVMRAMDTLKKGFVQETLHVLAALPHCLSSQEKRLLVLDWLKRHDFIFLARIGIGAGAAIVVLSGIMKYLLANQFSATYAFFFGLIVLSIVIPAKLIKHRTPALLLPFIAGLALTVMVTATVDPAQKAHGKSRHYQQQLSQADSTHTHEIRTYTPGDYFFGALSGAIAASAMVLPGISGSLVLILMGQYHVVLGAISDLKAFSIEAVLFLMLFSTGMALGMLLFAKIVNWVLARFYDMTMAFLLGLMAGSLWALWPFKATEVADLYQKTGRGIELVTNVVLQTNKNVFPTLQQAVAPIILFVAGCVVMGVFALKDEGKESKNAIPTK